MPDHTPTTRTLCRISLAALVLALGVLVALGGPAHAASPFAPGDLVLGLGSRQSILNPEGKLRHYAPDGTLIQTLLTTSGSIEETGPCFNPARNLFTTNFQVNSVSKFGADGSLLAGAFATGLNTHPNSCVFDRTGNLYVGLSDDSSGGFGNGALLRLDASGLVTASFAPLPDARGTDWIDLAADQCTLYYTSLGASIKRFDVCTNTQLPDFCTSCDDGAGGTASGPFFALRLLPGGGLLVADWNNFAGGYVRRYDSSGAQIQSYSASDTIGSFFPWGVALDPDFTSFWTVDNKTGQAFRFDLDSGSLLSSFLGGDCTALIGSCSVTGLAIAGEPTVAAPPVVAHITAANKVYDGNTSATVTTCYLTGVRPGDAGNVSCTAGSGAFDTASAGANKTVTAPVTLTDSSGGNYVLFSSIATTTASITPAPASVTPNPASKAYGTSDPAFTGSLSGFLADDNVTATYSRSAGESVAGSPYVISATLSPAAVLGNYAITYHTAAFTISPIAASVTPNPASKTYGTADPAFSGTLTGFLVGDGVTASYTRTAGESVAGSPYTISATLSPAGVLGNYTITYDTAAFTIDKANASVTPNPASKTYGAADPALTGTLTGFLAADGITASYSRTAGESVAGGPYTISATLTPAAALANYNVTYNTGSFTIAKASASVTPNAASKAFAAADPTFTGTLSGFLAADGVTATYSRTAGESVLGSPYVISATLSPAAALANYNITSNTASFTITPLAASVTPNPATKVYGSPDPALTGTLFGFLPASGISASFSRTAGENVAGSPYAISATLSPASALANYAITYNTAAFTITPATPVVTWVDPADISFPAPLSGTQLNAAASVPGSFVYSPPVATVLNVGNAQLLSVLFTPTDNSNYTTATAQVHINVLPGTPPQSEPGIALSKTANKSTATYGESVTYTYVVTNTGLVTLTDVTVADDNGTPAYAGDDFTVGTVASLAPGASATFTKTVVPPAALCNPDTGHACGSLVTQHRSDGTTKFTYLQSRDSRDNYSDGSGWSGSRSYSSKARFRVDGVDGVSSYVHDGWQGAGNSSYANSFSVVVNRSVCTKSDGSVKPPAIYHKKGWNGDWSRDWDVAHGWTDRSNRWDDDHDGYDNDDDYDQTKQPRYCPSVTTNTATAAGSANGTAVTATASASVSLVGPQSPAISINKSSNKPSVAFGESVTYTYVVTNTGNVALTNVKVVDDNGTPSYPADDFTVGTVASLAPGAAATFTRTLVPPTKMCRTDSYGASSKCGTLVTEHRGDGTTRFTYLQSKDQRDGYQGYGGWSGTRAYAHKAKFRVIDRTGTSSYETYGVMGSGDGYNYANAFSVSVNQPYVASSDGTVMLPMLYHKKGWHDDWRQDWDRSHGWTDRTHNWDDDKWWRQDNDADYDYDSGPAPCASSSTNVAKVTATAGGVTVSATDKETVQIVGSSSHASYVSYTQGGWGAKPYGNNPGRLLADHFAQLYPNGLVIGGVKTIKLTSASAVEAFLPQSGTPAKLTQSYVNPTSQISVLAGQVLALKLNVDFSVAGFLPTGFASLKVADGELNGMTVNSVLALGNSVLGGGTLPWGVSLSDLTIAISLINANFDGGTDDNGYLE